MRHQGNNSTRSGKGGMDEKEGGGGGLRRDRQMEILIRLKAIRHLKGRETVITI